jgi:hypothetical protein
MGDMHFPILTIGQDSIKNDKEKMTKKGSKYVSHETVEGER